MFTYPNIYLKENPIEQSIRYRRKNYRPSNFEQQSLPFGLDIKTIQEKSEIIERTMGEKSEIYISKLRLATRLSDEEIIYIAEGFLDYEVEFEKLIKNK